MKYKIRELRDFTGLTQKAFAKEYGIPLSTLCKWEQGEASPASYVVDLIARTIPQSCGKLQKITSSGGSVFYYDEVKHLVMDAEGNAIRVGEDLSSVKAGNLGIYLEDLYDSYYESRAKFERDCRLDKKEDIIWSRG